MIRRILLLSALIICCCTFSQKQANFWYFGLNAGLDFNSGSPVVLSNGALSTTEGCSTISDASGNLLFYTDGISVWNKNNVVMPNGTGLFGDVSTTQSGLIIPKPGSSTLFYIFTLDFEGGPNGLCYSIVDLSLNGGNGDVTVKNTPLKTNMTEKLTAVFHCNGTDIWVMTHDFNSNAFTAYLVSSAGVGPAVVSNVGGIHSDVHGQMKFNTNGTKIACIRDTVLSITPFNGIAFVDVLKFNNTTGVVSSPTVLTLNNHQKAYGLEFSPDNTKLYAQYYDVTGLNGGNSAVVQFNFSAANLQASMVIIGSSLDPDILRALQLGPDGKIYVAKSNTPFLCVINSPNASGLACNYANDVINLDPLSNGVTVQLGLPGFIQSYFNPAFPTVPCAITADYLSSDTTICWGSCINFKDMTTGGPPTSWKWTFEGASTPTSSVKNPANICYPASGTFTVKLVASNGTNSDSIVKTIYVVAPIVSAGTDVTITAGTSTTLNATGNVNTYTWSPSAGLSNANIASPAANPVVTTTYVVTGKDLNNCTATSSVTVYVNEAPCGELFVPTAFSPNNDGENDVECVIGNCIDVLDFSIYDRWGEKVFQTTDQAKCWDGQLRGKLMDTGVFVYHLTATFKNGDTINKKGNIHLIR